MTSKAPVINVLLDKVLSGDEGEVDLSKIKDLSEQIDKDLRLIVDDEKFSEAILHKLFPDGVPPDESFYLKLESLFDEIRFSELHRDALSSLWTASSRILSVPAFESLLISCLKLESHYFFSFLDKIPALFNAIELRPAFAVELLPALARKVENDLSGGVFWDALGGICLKSPQNCLEIVRNFHVAEDRTSLSIAAFLLGVLRVVSKDDHFVEVEQRLKNSQNKHMRFIYIQSWVQTARRGAMTLDDFEALLDELKTDTNEEIADAFWCVTKSVLSPEVPAKAFSKGVDWLRARVVKDLTDDSKYIIVDFVTQLSDRKDFTLIGLMLDALPLPSENKGSWNRIEHLLVNTLKHDFDLFSDLLVSLAENSPKGLLDALRESRRFEWIIDELKGKDLTSLICQLWKSRNSTVRKIGFLIFSKYPINSIPEGWIKENSELGLRVLFYEFQRTFIPGPVVANFFLCIVPLSSECSADFREELYEEMSLQAKNYGGPFLDIIRTKKSAHEELEIVIDETEKYFEKLRDVDESGICAMNVEGYFDAIRLHGRRFSNEVATGAEKMSIFAQFCKKLHILYGRKWRVYQGGVLGESSEMQAHSHSVEIPRVEMVDPESMAIRRLYASSQISRLSQQQNETKG